MVKNKLYKMYGIGSLFLVLEWDVLFINFGVIDIIYVVWNVYCVESDCVNRCGGFLGNRNNKYSYNARYVYLGRKFIS